MRSYVRQVLQNGGATAEVMFLCSAEPRFSAPARFWWIIAHCGGQRYRTSPPFPAFNPPGSPPAGSLSRNSHRAVADAQGCAANGAIIDSNQLRSRDRRLW
jgi:hypothetical protein